MYKTILVAVDTNDLDGATRVAKAASAVAAADGDRLHVVNVVPDTGMAIVGAALGPERVKQLMVEAKDSLREFCTQILPDVTPADIHLAEGTIYDSIIRTAKKIDADLIVVGSHRPELRDYLVGPNSARVARHAPQSVLIVR
jgi:nucleotide-binding universal stress UspA family protein